MLDIILRTHNTSNVHGEQPRYCATDKTTLMLKCVTSLVASMNQCDAELRLTILDDHSTEDFLAPLKTHLLPRSRHPVVLRHLTHGGANASALAQFEAMRQCDGLVYSIEDDYLHEASAIAEMLATYAEFHRRTAPQGLDVALFPFDMPDGYQPPWLSPCTVVHGPSRHWATSLWSTNSVLVPADVVRRHWSWFELLAREYGTPWGRAHNIHEGTTLAQVWSSDTRLYTPIPSIALHMQFDAQRDPYIDWRARWAAVPDWTEPGCPAPSAECAGLVREEVLYNEPVYDGPSTVALKYADFLAQQQKETR